MSPKTRWKLPPSLWGPGGWGGQLRPLQDLLRGLAPSSLVRRRGYGSDV